METPLDVSKQEKVFSDILLSNREIRQVLAVIKYLNLPECYLGAGALAQTVWNNLTKRSNFENIKDFDIVYYDPNDLSGESEKEIELRIRNLLNGFNVDVKNEARVHLWYESKFGKIIPQYKSTEDAIDTWPTTSTAIGVRMVRNELKIYAPYGLEDVLSMTLRPNQKLITKDVYYKKVERYTKEWPELNVIEWIE
ncbi:MAG: nucleotidyltransferase family protein [Candidatus Dojkabacteria bacterium]